MKQTSLSVKIMAVVLVVGLAAAFIYCKKSKPKVGFIVIEEVFNGFELKNELQKKFEGVKNVRQKVVDSLRIDLTILSKKVQTNVATKDEQDMFERKRIEFNQKMQAFEEENTLLTKQYDSEIVTQLNQYVRDFGKQEDYDMILGNADGSLMYGKDQFNVTKEVILFINNRYKGVSH